MLSRLRRQAALVLTLSVLAAGCGLPVQERPAPLRTNPVPTETEPPPRGAYAVQVYLVEEGRLVPAIRRTDDRSPESLLEILTEGPTAIEEADGVTTALSPGPFKVKEGSAASSPTSSAQVVVEVPAEFTQVDGDLQLLATAQLVWTVTDPRPRGWVRMVHDGEVIELPTDKGLTSRPVRRSDFGSVAPAEAQDAALLR